LLLAFAGRTRKLQVASFGIAGRESFAMNLIFSVSLAMDER
jgi:hypothetical protein